MECQCDQDDAEDAVPGEEGKGYKTNHKIFLQAQILETENAAVKFEIALKNFNTFTHTKNQGDMFSYSSLLDLLWSHL